MEATAYSSLTKDRLSDEVWSALIDLFRPPGPKHLWAASVTPEQAAADLEAFKQNVDLMRRLRQRWVRPVPRCESEKMMDSARGRLAFFDSYSMMFPAADQLPPVPRMACSFIAITV